MTIVNKLVLAFISFQGLLLIVDPFTKNRHYSTFAAVSNTAMPLIQQIAEHGRVISSIALLPTILYGKSWLIPQFISLIIYVFYICLTFNVYLHHTLQDIGIVIVHVLVLMKFLIIIVDNMTQIENQNLRIKNDQIRKKNDQILKNRMKNQQKISQNHKEISQSKTSSKKKK